VPDDINVFSDKFILIFVLSLELSCFYTCSTFPSDWPHVKGSHVTRGYALASTILE
jgi:hypothetical protein